MTDLQVILLGAVAGIVICSMYVLATAMIKSAKNFIYGPVYVLVNLSVGGYLAKDGFALVDNPDAAMKIRSHGAFVGIFATQLSRLREQKFEAVEYNGVK